MIGSRRWLLPCVALTLCLAVLAWWLLNLNEHDTHHRRTKVVWYELPDAGTDGGPAGADGGLDAGVPAPE